MLDSVVGYKRVSVSGTYTVDVLSGERFKHQLLYALVVYTSAAGAGDRLIKISIKDNDSNEVFHCHAGNTQPASKTHHYYLMPGIYRETTFVTSESGVDGNLQVPIPYETIVLPQWTLTVLNSNGTNASDSVSVDALFKILQ